MRVRITQSKKNSSGEGECAEASMRKLEKITRWKALHFVPPALI